MWNCLLSLSTSPALWTCTFLPGSFLMRILNYPSSVPSFIGSFLHLFLPSLVPSFIGSFLHLFLPSLVPSFIGSFLHLFLPSSVPSFICSFLHLFFPSLVPSVIASFSRLQCWLACVGSFLPSVGWRMLQGPGSQPDQDHPPHRLPASHLAGGPVSGPYPAFLFYFL